MLSFLLDAGVPLDRVMTLPYASSRAEHLVMYGSMDISLDTFPYNGTTTTCESLWMGVPVVTSSGNSHASRVGRNILARMNLSGFIAASASGYVDVAVRLANDRERLRGLRLRLRDEMKNSSLVDARRFARQVEDAYRAMWHKWCMS